MSRPASSPVVLFLLWTTVLCCVVVFNGIDGTFGVVSAFVLPTSLTRGGRSPLLTDTDDAVSSSSVDGSVTLPSSSFSSSSSASSPTALYSIRFLKGQVSYGDSNGATATGASAYLPNGGDASTTLLRNTPAAARSRRRPRSASSLWYRNAINPSAPRTRLAFGSMEIFPVTTEHVQVLIEKSTDETLEGATFANNNVVDQGLMDRSVQAVMEQWQQRRRKPPQNNANQAFPSYQPSQVIDEQCTQTVRVSVQDGELYPFVGTVSTPVLEGRSKNPDEEDSVIMTVHNAPATANTPSLGASSSFNDRNRMLQPGTQGGPITASSISVLEAAVLPLVGTTPITASTLAAASQQPNSGAGNVQKKTVGGNGSTQTFKLNTRNQEQQQVGKQQIQVVLESQNNGQVQPWEARIEVWHGINDGRNGAMKMIDNLPLPGSNGNKGGDDCRIALDIASKHKTFSTIMDIMPASVLEQYYARSVPGQQQQYMQQQGTNMNGYNSNNNRYNPPKSLEQFLEIRVINTGNSALQASVIQQPRSNLMQPQADRVVRPNPTLLQQQSRIRSMETPMTATSFNRIGSNDSFSRRSTTISSDGIRYELDKSRPQLQPNPFLAQDEASRRSSNNMDRDGSWSQRNMDRNGQTRFVGSSISSTPQQQQRGGVGGFFNGPSSQQTSGRVNGYSQQQQRTSGVVPGRESSVRPQLTANPFLNRESQTSQQRTTSSFYSNGSNGSSSSDWNQRASPGQRPVSVRRFDSGLNDQTGMMQPSGQQLRQQNSGFSSNAWSLRSDKIAGESQERTSPKNGMMQPYGNADQTKYKSFDNFNTQSNTIDRGQQQNGSTRYQSYNDSAASMRSKQQNVQSLSNNNNNMSRKNGMSLSKQQNGSFFSQGSSDRPRLIANPFLAGESRTDQRSADGWSRRPTKGQPATTVGSTSSYIKNQPTKKSQPFFSNLFSSNKVRDNSNIRNDGQQQGSRLAPNPFLPDDRNPINPYAGESARFDSQNQYSQNTNRALTRVASPSPSAAFGRSFLNQNQSKQQKNQYPRPSSAFGRSTSQQKESMQQRNQYPRPSSAFGTSSSEWNGPQQQANALPRPSSAFGRSNAAPVTSARQEKNQFPRPSSAFGRSNADQMRQRELQQRPTFESQGVPVRADAGLLDEKASRIEYGMTTEEERYRYELSKNGSNGVSSKWDLNYWMDKSSMRGNKDKPTYRRNGQRDTRFDPKPRSSSESTPWINRDYSSSAYNRQSSPSARGVGMNTPRSSSLSSRQSSWKSGSNQRQDATYNGNRNDVNGYSRNSPSSSSFGSFDSSMEDFRNQGGTRSYTDSVSNSYQRVDAEDEMLRRQQQQTMGRNGSSSNKNFLNSYSSPNTNYRNGNKAPSNQRNSNDDGGFLSVAKQLFNGLRWDDEYMESRRENNNNNNYRNDRGRW
jgi:hypothetical protein